MRDATKNPVGTLPGLGYVSTHDLFYANKLYASVLRATISF